MDGRLRRSITRTSSLWNQPLLLIQVRGSSETVSITSVSPSQRADLSPVVERLLLFLRLVGTSVRVDDAPVVVALDQVHEQARLHDDLMRVGILIEHPGRPERIAPDVRPGELDLLPGHALDLRRHFGEERNRVFLDGRVGHDAPRIRLPRWAREPDAREIHLAIGHAGWRTTRGQRHGHDVAPGFNESLVPGRPP